MSGLIVEIQKACLDDTVPVESLLRRLKLAATKLRLGDLEGWVESELNGYSGELPRHRILRGRLEAWNPYHGWIPVQFRDAELAEMLGTAEVRQGIGGLRDLISHRDDSGEYHYPVPDKAVIELNKYLDFETSKMILKLPRGGIVGILDFVRNKVLDWALEMERNGVVGEGLSFDDRELESAKIVMTTFNIGNIDNFAGNMGSGNSTGDVNLTVDKVTEISEALDKLRNVVPVLVQAGASDSLSSVVDAAVIETAKDAPDTTKLKGLFIDIRSALSGAAGNLTAEGAMQLVGGVLRALGGG